MMLCNVQNAFPDECLHNRIRDCSPDLIPVRMLCPGRIALI